MASTRSRALKFDFSAIKDDLGEESLANLIENIGVEWILEAIGHIRVVKWMIKNIGADDGLIASLSASELKTLREALK